MSKLKNESRIAPSCVQTVAIGSVSETGETEGLLPWVEEFEVLGPFEIAKHPFDCIQVC